MGKACLEVLPQFSVMDSEDSLQGLQGTFDDLIVVKAGKFARIASSSPSGEHGKRQRMARPPGGKVFIGTRHEAQGFQSAFPELRAEAENHTKHWPHLQIRRRHTFERHVRSEAQTH